MSGFETIVGQDPAVGALMRLLKNGRMPHSLLFLGIDGVGKRTAAIRLAMALNCTGNAGMMPTDGKTAGSHSAHPCGQCRSCLRIAEEIHPDVTVIRPENGIIKIAQIRDLCRILSMKPFEGNLRVAILSHAHLMNPSAGNALLKMLEEPPEKTLLILTAGQVADLLPTIVSRCQHIRFAPVARKTLSEGLAQHHGLGMDDASVVAALAEGSFSRALAMNDIAWMNQRNWLITELARLGASPLHVVLALSEKLSKNRNTLSEIFEIMITWFRDLLIVAHDPGKIINRDHLEDVRAASGRYTESQLIQSVHAVKSAQAHVKAKTNIRLSMDQLLLRLWQQQSAGSN